MRSESMKTHWQHLMRNWRVLQSFVSGMLMLRLFSSSLPKEHALCAQEEQRKQQRQSKDLTLLYGLFASRFLNKGCVQAG